MFSLSWNESAIEFWFLSKSLFLSSLFVITLSMSNSSARLMGDYSSDLGLFKISRKFVFGGSMCSFIESSMSRFGVKLNETFWFWRFSLVTTSLMLCGILKFLAYIPRRCIPILPFSKNFFMSYSGSTSDSVYSGFVSPWMSSLMILSEATLCFMANGWSLLWAVIKAVTLLTLAHDFLEVAIFWSLFLAIRFSFCSYFLKN